jgi:hypothetical protein
MGMKFLVDDCSICEIVSRVVTWRRLFHYKVVSRKGTLIEQIVLTSGKLFHWEGFYSKWPIVPQERIFPLRRFLPWEGVFLRKDCSQGLFQTIIPYEEQFPCTVILGLISIK